MFMSIVATAAALGCGYLRATGVPAAAVLSALAFGPALDLATYAAAARRNIYASLVCAGIGANLAALIAKLGLYAAGWAPFEPRLVYALGTYTICGALAGLLSAVAWFKYPRPGSADA